MNNRSGSLFARSNRPIRSACGWALAAAVLLAAGCSQVPVMEHDMNGPLKAISKSGPILSVSEPRLVRANDDLVVSGYVERKPGVDDQIPGFLLVSVRSRGGQVLDFYLVSWIPKDIPTDGDRRARYQIRFLGVPPDGSSVKVEYVAKFSDLDNIPYEPAGGLGGPSHGTGGGGHSGGSFSTGAGSGKGFGSSFGQNNFGNIGGSTGGKH